MIKNIFTLFKNIQIQQIPQRSHYNQQLFYFGSKQKKEKIIKLQKPQDVQEEKLLKIKTEEYRAYQDLVVEKNKEAINSMSFDQLSMRMKQEKIAMQQFTKNNNNLEQSKDQDEDPLKSVHNKNKKPQDQGITNEDTISNQSQIKILLTDKDKQLNFENFQFPWDFESTNQVQKEQNLKSAIEVTKIIDEKTAVDLYKKFLLSIQKSDFEQLAEIVERRFLRQLQKCLEQMKQENIQMKFDNMDTNQINVDLYKVQNIFGVGVEQNRRKNDGSNSYVIFDDFIDQKIPAKHIVKKRPEPKELARIYVQLHLNFESDISLTLINENKGTKKMDSISQNKQNKQYHTLILEKVIVECDYKSIRDKSNSMKAAQDSTLRNQNDFVNISNMKNYASASNLKIIDFDNFMKGNPLVKEVLDQD